MDHGPETEGIGIARRVIYAAAVEARELLVGLLIMLPVIFILFYAFSYGETGRAASFLTFLRELPLDANGFPILDRLWPAIGVSAALVGGALLVSVPLSSLLGWIAAVRPHYALLRTAAILVSCVPVFAFGRYFLARSTWFFLPALALGLGDLALSMIATHIYSEMTLELRRLYLCTAKAKGAAPWRHYWRRLAAEIVSSIKPRIPFLVGGAVVVERIFNLHGLGNMAVTAVEGRVADLNVVVWICVVSVVFVRLAGTLERMAKIWLVRSRPPERIEDVPAAPILPVSHDAEPSPVTKPADSACAPAASPAARARTHRGEIAFLWRTLRFALRRQRANVRWFLRSIPAARAQFAVSVFFWSVALVLLLLCVSGWQPYKPGTMSDSLDDSNAGPSRRYLLGTDHQGQDVLTETLAAGGKLVVPCLIAVIVPVALGVPLGAYCGYEPHGLFARFIQYLADLMDAVPKLIIVLVAYVLIDVEHYLLKILPVMGFTFTPLIYHHVRERVAALREAGFVEAERMLGVSPWRIILVHLLFNNCRSVVLVHGSHILGNVILMDAALDYLQLAQPAYYTWGALFYNQLDHAQKSALPSNALAYLAPLGAIIVAACAFVLLSDFLRSVMERPEFSV